MRTERLKKPCIRCDKVFQPTGRFQKLCEKCKKERQEETTIKLRAVNYGR